MNYDNSCGSGTQSPALDQLRWLDLTLERAETSAEFVWLLMHIPPGINSYNSSEIVHAGGAPVTFWQPELTSQFLKLVQRHRRTLRLAFAGHTHMDDFRVIRTDGRLPCSAKSLRRSVRSLATTQVIRSMNMTGRRVS